MTKRLTFSLPIALALLLFAVSAGAQTAYRLDAEFGFRTLDVSGNEQMYRTQINERGGFLLSRFALQTAAAPGADSLRIYASDLGVGPAGGLRIEATRADRFRFTLSYRHANLFSALPAFANPLLTEGVTTGQHTYDRTRNVTDAELEFLPGKSISPFIGFSVNEFSGPGRTTYHQGGDEFVIAQDLHDRDQEVRAGAGFRFGSVYGSLTQGWRRATTTERFTLAGPEGGNFPGPVLGHTISAGSILRDDHTTARTPFTNFYVSDEFAKRVRLTANYVRSSAASRGDESESVAGSFVSFALSRFFEGLSETATSDARNRTWRGGGRAEITLVDGVDLLAGFEKEHRELEGSALIDTIFLQTITFGGVDPRDVITVLNAQSSLDRDDSVANVGISAREIGPFALRAEYRDTRREVTVTPDLSEIVVPGIPPAGPPQGGTLDRHIKTWDFNGSFSRSGLTLGAAYRRESADAPIFRTDFLDRDRVRLRAGWAAPRWVRTGVVFERTKQSNDQTGIDMDGTVQQYSGNVEVMPVKVLTLRAALSSFKADDAITYRLPQNFNTADSLYRENGRSREGGASLVMKPVSVEASVTRFKNRGDYPFEINRARLRVGFDLPAKTKTGIIAQFDKDKYRDNNLSFANFDAKRYGLFLRYKP